MLHVEKVGKVLLLRVCSTRQIGSTVAGTDARSDTTINCCMVSTCRAPAKPPYVSRNGRFSVS